jgi:hypothetical protein
METYLFEARPSVVRQRAQPVQPTCNNDRIAPNESANRCEVNSTTSLHPTSMSMRPVYISRWRVTQAISIALKPVFIRKREINQAAGK